MDNFSKIVITTEESAGMERIMEPVTFGIPFPKGYLKEKTHLGIYDSKGNTIPFQIKILSNWQEQSVKWALLDILVNCEPKSAVNYYLILKDQPFLEEGQHYDSIKIEESNSSITIDTEKAIFIIDKKTFMPFRQVNISGVNVIDQSNSCMMLKDEFNREYTPKIKNISIETRGLIRSTVKAQGQFVYKDGSVFSDFLARASFYAGKRFAKIDFTIRNSKASKHPGGLWDLGDEGSIYFKDLSFNFALTEKKDISIFWKTEINEKERRLNNDKIEIYQDSSGGVKWDSLNHVNKNGKVMNSFRGYKVYSVDLLEQGFRATPTIVVQSQNRKMAATLQKFWQNSPKAIEAENNLLTLRLFPHQYNDVYELQGGEQKTHTIFLVFGHDNNEDINIDWVHAPLVAKASPNWYAKTGAHGYLASAADNKNPDYQALIEHAILGDKNFFDLREEVDEYGWRNFGEVYADHEIVNYKGGRFPFISHYNNQYDVINGCILQYLRSGDIRWYDLMTDLTKHVIDIDIYHTTKDRNAFNNGTFWHTNHFMHAETSTHRSFSCKHQNNEKTYSYGGGPSPENCYSTGLLNYYYLTGEELAKETILELSKWILSQDKMDNNLIGIIRGIKKRISSSLNEFSGSPTRSQANMLNTLLDAFELTNDREYLSKAEKLIKKFISPVDDINRFNENEVIKFGHILFLQSLGKYLDVKEGMDEKDDMYNYTKKSFLYHAMWMLDNEVPYKKIFHKLDIPSSTWPAHDVRKSAIFNFAYKYADGPLKHKFKAKAEFFFNTAIKDVLSFSDESMYFVRPLAVLMHYGVMHIY
jgi:hypothetical protein